MLPEPFVLIRSALLRSTRPALPARLMVPIAASTLLTIFYTPGGAAGWVLDLLLRGYLAVARRAPGSPHPRPVVLVTANHGDALPTAAVGK